MSRYILTQKSSLSLEIKVNTTDDVVTFTATSSKEDLHRRIGGRCFTNNMKVVFKVCCRPDEMHNQSKHPLNSLELVAFKCFIFDIFLPIQSTVQCELHSCVFYLISISLLFCKAVLADTYQAHCSTPAVITDTESFIKVTMQYCLVTVADPWLGGGGG